MAGFGFRRSATGRLVLRADSVERELLESLVTQLEELVAPGYADPDADPLARLVGIDPAARVPTDPALARLFPDAYADDAEAAGEFRRFTERGLREGKVAAARVVRDSLVRSGDKLVLTAAEGQAWLHVLTDLRLTLGTRLEITEDNHDELAALPQDDPRAAMLDVYDWLTYLQETLVRAVMSSGA
ncbi:MAG: DUF2017 domain-containing protein [Actinomycetota bacterium]|nr:MAG: DUF2017 domain-containing protein [Actinomycetota bacterium]